MTAVVQALAALWPGLNFADTDGTLEGVRYDDPLPPGFTPPTQGEIDLKVARSARLAATLAGFDAAVAAGVAYGGKVLQIRDADRANIAGQCSRANASLIAGSGVTWPAGFAWRMADNSYLPLATAADMLALGEAAADRYAALRRRLGELKDAIAGAADLAALEAIDVAAAWE